MKGWILACLLVLTACESLKKDGALTEILPGRWAFSYVLSQDVGVELSVDHVEFHDDGTCSVEYEGKSYTADYLAGDGTIWLRAVDGEGNEREMLWRVLSFSNHSVVAEYEIEYGGQVIVATIYLER